MNCCSPVHLPYCLVVRRGPWAIRMGTGQRTRSILLATEFSTSVDRLTSLTPSPRLTGFNRSLSTTQWLTFTVAVTIPFFRQDPFNFNVEISVSCNLCRYQDPAGFLPRGHGECSGSPATFQAPIPGRQAPLKQRVMWDECKATIGVNLLEKTAWKTFHSWHHCLIA